MRPVLVLILHAEAPADAGPLVRALAGARRGLAERQRSAFLDAGADLAEIVSGPPDGLSFGERLAAEWRRRSGASATSAPAPARVPAGLIVLGSGSIPLATAADLRRFVEVAAGPGGHALANNRYSADVVAISRAADLAELPPLPADNAFPRWLDERAGVMVTDLRSRWRLGVDVDTPLDLIVLGTGARALFGEVPASPVADRLAALTEVIANRRAELLVAGRVSAATLSWLQLGIDCRVRALIEERGLKAASRLAQAESGGATAGATAPRPPHSILGDLLDRDGPEALAATVARLGDAAVIDTRVLMAHRYGGAESGWPTAEDRFASDLLMSDLIADPWLRALTISAASAPADHPIILGGHTLVNGGIRLLAQRARGGSR